MNPKHKAIAENVYKIALFSLVESGRDTPLFVLIKDNQSIPILIPPGLEIDVASYTMMSLNLAREQNADAIMVVSGMWVVTGEIDDIDLTIRPSESDMKEHYLNLVYMTADGSEFNSIAGKVEIDPQGTKFIRHHEWLDNLQQFEYFQPWR
ncbi:hypothetical protein KAR91_68635 [Candidatus Pacearchaeota archaeon]|nr:hypothetical protein [Candidatus Pacearchaeota archaeon]